MNTKEIFVLIMVSVVLAIFMLKSFSSIPFFKDMDRAYIMLVPVLAFFIARTLGVEEMESIPWNILLLFGGAMSIGYCLYDTRAAEWMAASWFQSAPWLLFVLVITFLVLCLTSFIINVATIAIALPISLVIATYLGVAPNAIAYESKHFTTGDFFLCGCVPSAILMTLLAIFSYFIFHLADSGHARSAQVSRDS